MRPLVCLHGFTGRGESWREVLDALPPGIDAWCPDLLGHGADPPEAGSFEGEVDRLARGVEAHQGAGPASTGAVLAGYSLGARLALGLLVRHRWLFSSAVLISARAGLASAAERRARAEADERLARQLETDGLERFVDRWQALPLFASQACLPAERLAAQRRLRLGHDPQGLARSLRRLGLAAMPDYRPELPELDLPVRLLVGGEDDKFRAAAGEMVELLPRASLLTFAGAGHNLPLERPLEVAEVIREEIHR